MKTIPQQEIYELHAHICQSLCDAKRLLILNELRAGEKSVGELAETLHLKQSNVSQHLAFMRERGILEHRREGAMIYYRVANDKIIQALDLLRDVMGEVLEKQSQLLHRFNV